MSKYRLIEAAKNEHAVERMCCVLKVSRAAYYRWRSGKPRPREQRDEELLHRLAAIRRGFGKAYGPVRMRRQLQKDDVHCGLRRLRRLMGTQGWVGKRSRGYRRSTLVACDVPDLVERDFSAAAPGEKFVCDITQISIAGVWLYLAVVIDCFSRRVAGWSMSTKANAVLVTSALEMALARTDIAAGAIVHSDRGSQYTAAAFRAALGASGLRQSLGAPGQCWDNALAESFFASLKKELSTVPPATSLNALRSRVFEYVECFYNPVRLHSALAYCSPLDYEAAYYAARRSA